MDLGGTNARAAAVDRATGAIRAVVEATTRLDPARVILGGGMLLGCERLLQLVRDRFDASISALASDGRSLELAHLGDDAGVIGAALLDG